jgi:hypothetical protein
LIDTLDNVANLFPRLVDNDSKRVVDMPTAVGAGRDEIAVDTEVPDNGFQIVIHGRSFSG